MARTWVNPGRLLKLILEQGTLRRSAYGIRDQVSGWRIWIGVISWARRCFANRRIFGLRLGDCYRGSFVYKGEKLGGGIRMKAQTTMGMRNWPDSPLVKTVSGLEFHPIGHRIADIVIAGTWSVIAGSCPYIIASGPKTVRGRTLFSNLSADVIRSRGSRCTGFADGGWRDQ